MLRAVSTVYFESQAFEVLRATRRDVFKFFRTNTTTSTSGPGQQTVLSSAAGAAPPPAPANARVAQPPPAAPPPPPPRRTWAVAAAVAVTASIGGIYFFRKLSDRTEKETVGDGSAKGSTERAEEEQLHVVPEAGAFPAHVPFLLVGGGTASFAAMRALRSARPEAQVLIVGAEDVLPYMRPPLSKELWREPGLAQAARDPHSLSFRQWNGKRRSLIYEPEEFYTPLSELAASEGGVSMARGWHVATLDVRARRAVLRAPSQPDVEITYDKCLIATGSQAVRLGALRDAARSGRALALRGARDAARLAARLEPAPVRRVAVLGGGLLAAELSAALADSLRETGKSVVTVCREPAPLATLLPDYLAAEARRRLEAAGAEVLTNEEVVEAKVDPVSGRVVLTLSSGARLDVDLVVECAGAEPDVELARAAGLELHPELGGIVVNSEMQAISDVWAAGDVSCFYDAALGRRRVEHHDHAVVSGRLAGENMAAVAPPKHYEHQSMFWSDLGPDLGYEAIGIIDSRLPTVGVFSADDVTELTAHAVAADTDPINTDSRTDVDVESKQKTDGITTADVATTIVQASGKTGEGQGAGSALGRRYERGVVLYMREQRVVGVLLWNLFNRMHVARQVLMQGEFDDLFEVGKLFSLHEDD